MRNLGRAGFVCFLGLSSIYAEELKQPRTAAALLAELDSEDFETREKAETELKKTGAAALPVLRTALEKCESLELKTRLTRIIPYLHIEAESDPEKLMAISAEAAGKSLFGVAARGYARAELGFKELSTKTKSTSEFADLRMNQSDAARRMKLMAVAGRSDKRVGAALAALYPRLKTGPFRLGDRDVELQINDKSDMTPVEKSAGLDELIMSIVDVASSSNAAHSVEEQNGKLIIMTMPVVHELIKELLSEIRVRMKSE